MKYKAAVFDMDGTILDTVTDLKLSLEYAFTKAGYPELSHITGEDTKSFFGSGARVAIQRAFSSKSITASETDISEVEAIYRPYYDMHCAENTCPYPGILSLIVFRINSSKEKN